MSETNRVTGALLLTTMLLLPVPVSPAGAGPSARNDTAALESALRKPYVNLFEVAPNLHFTGGQIAAMARRLEDGQKSCVRSFKQREKQYESQAKQAQDELKRSSAKLDEGERHSYHCRIQELQMLRSQADVLAKHAIPYAYQNREAKLELIQKWPDEYRRIQQAKRTGDYHKRHWGDVEDIGFRQIAAGQEKDIKAGQDIDKEMKAHGMMPPEIEDTEISSYVESVARRVTDHSDLHVPLHVKVLNSKEVNAFALPGGYLYVERGLLEAADDESELAGVIGHEISHDVARHSHKLMKRATIAGIFYNAAEVAALIMTGGVVGLGTYYALQYGFYGLGLALDLKLLGVSREYELEADTLGIQYTWNAGYDPSGFIRFFDKMATKEGYVNGVSWFRTHPPFFERMVNAEREIQFLPKKEKLEVNTTAFLNMKERLKKATAKAEQEGKNKPSLYEREKGCPKPTRIDYKAGDDVEKLCSESRAAVAALQVTCQEPAGAASRNKANSVTP